MNVVREIQRINERELESGLAGQPGSWHDEYRSSAHIFVKGLDPELTEGDVLFGEVAEINMVREKGAKESKGFCFIGYEDQRSTVLAVDNLNGTQLVDRTICVDHVKDYNPHVQVVTDPATGAERFVNPHRLSESSRRSGERSGGAASRSRRSRQRSRDSSDRRQRSRDDSERRRDQGHSRDSRRSRLSSDAQRKGDRE